MKDLKSNRDLKEQLGKRWGALKTERSSWMSHWRECSEFILPRNGRFLATDRNKGGDRTNAIYDNTATRAARTLAAGMLGGMTSPARPWFRLTLTDTELADHQPVKIWLAEVTRRMQRAFSVSNTYRALHSMYEELGTFGTASNTMLDDFDKMIHLYPHTIGEYALATDYKGAVNTQYRQFQKTAGQLVMEFGYENCSRHVQRLWDNSDYDKWVTVIHAVEPRGARDPRKLDARNMPFRSTYFEEGGDEDRILRDSGFKRFRCLTPRWSTVGQDVYGHSPGMEVLGDAKQLQHEQFRKAQGIDYQTKPPVQINGTMKSAGANMLPGGATYIDSANPSGGARALFDSRIDLSYLLEDIRDVRDRIRGGYYTDLFLMLGSMDNARMTATEVAERHEEKLLMLGPVLERLHNELLDPLIEMTFERMLEAGDIPPPPEELDGVALDIEFVSMLAQAQRAVGLNSSDRFIASLGAVAQMKPGVLDKFDEDQWADVYADSLGVDPSMIVGDDRVAIIREERLAQQQQAAAQEQAVQMAETAAKLGSVNTAQPNGLTDVMQGLTGYGSPAPYNVGA
ncbi:MAG TPA: portal protein [Brevundimonas diminuta]|nr:portal protein [Brevundimonas diminuta]HRL23332.1 portal protein [Brevundimonas diminuta]